MSDAPLVAIVMGSESDRPTMQKCVEVLDAYGVVHDVVVRSAHRDPEGCRQWATSADAEEAAELARIAAEAVDPAGRPLAAANTAVPWPGEAHLVLWQALTTLREHRGDGHNAALLSREVGGAAAHVLASAAGRTDREWLMRARGWDEEAWAVAAAELADRGWLDAVAVVKKALVSEDVRQGKRVGHVHHVEVRAEARQATDPQQFVQLGPVVGEQELLAGIDLEAEVEFVKAVVRGGVGKEHGEDPVAAAAGVRCGCHPRP